MKGHQAVSSSDADEAPASVLEAGHPELPRRLPSRRLSSFATPICAASLLAGGLAAAPAASQEVPSESPGLLWMSEPEPVPDVPASDEGLVFVSVVVTDPDHRPVEGLPEEAFFLQDGGLAMPVLSFQPVDRGAGTTQPAAPRVSTNTLAPDTGSGRDFVVVFDDAHLAPASAEAARRTARRFLTEHTRPGDQVVLVAPEAGLTRSAEMPGGRASLLALIDSLSPRREPAPLLSDDESFGIADATDETVEERVLERLRSAGALPARAPEEWLRGEARRLLEGARERRRRLLTSLADVLEVLTTPRTRKAVLLVSEGFIHDPRDRLSYEVLAASQRAHAAVYLLDPRRLGEAGPEESAGGPLARPPSRRERRAESMGAELLANVTGGSVFEDAASLGEALTRLAAETDSYYLLGYRPDGAAPGERLRRIRVVVDRPDVVARTRRGFWEAPWVRRGADHQPLAGLDEPLREALGASSPMRQIPLRLTALTLAPTRDGRVEVAIVSEANAGPLSLLGEPDGSTAELDFVVDVRHVQREASQLGVPEPVAFEVPGDAAPEERWLAVRRRVTLAPGLSQVKVAVRDRSSGLIGTVAQRLMIPDPADLRTSSPILSDVPEGTGATPPRVVARRSFASGSVLYCYFEVFPGSGRASPASDGEISAYEVVDRRGKVRVRAALPIPVRTRSGGLGRLLEIPLGRVEPGQYELVVALASDAAGGPAELREPFSVARPASFDDALYRNTLGAYLEGDFERAGATLLQWPPEEILAAARTLPEDDDRLRRSALLLHTELAMLLRRHGLSERAEHHLDIARALLEGSAHSELHEQWLLAVAYAYQEASHPAEALEFYEECARVFPGSGVARLGAGTLHERYAFLPDGFARGNLNLPPQLAAREAERSYREALEVQPGLTEARLRLARVFQQTGRPDEALAQLALVVESSDDATLSALAHLFWGEISEGRDDVTGAIGHYRAAIAAEPGLQVAALALAQALHRRVGRQAALGALAPALAVTDTSPWLAYRLGPLRLAAATLHEMRSRLRAAVEATP